MDSLTGLDGGKDPTSEEAASHTHQLPLDGEDAVPSSFAVGLPPRYQDHLRVAVFCGKVNLGIGFLSNL